MREILLEISDISSPCEAITACLTPIIGIYYNRYISIKVYDRGIITEDTFNPLLKSANQRLRLVKNSFIDYC